LKIEDFVTTIRNTDPRWYDDRRASSAASEARRQSLDLIVALNLPGRDWDGRR
jgi:hypothetical protein